MLQQPLGWPQLRRHPRLPFLVSHSSRGRRRRAAGPHNGYGTADEAMANHAAFMAQSGAGEDRIAGTVGE